MLLNTVNMFGLYIVFNIIYPITVNSLIDWLLKASIVSLIIVITYISTNYCFNNQETKNVISFCFGLIKSRNKNNR